MMDLLMIIKINHGATIWENNATTRIIWLLPWGRYTRVAAETLAGYYLLGSLCKSLVAFLYNHTKGSVVLFLASTEWLGPKFF